MRFLAIVLLLSVLFCQPVYSTTIVWDGEKFACDSQVTTLDKEGHPARAYVGYPKIKYLQDKNLLIGFAGSLKDIDQALRVFEGKDDKPFKGRFQAIMIDGAGGVSLYIGNTDSPIKFKEKTQIAIGSGAPYATAALACGKDAVDAVKIASKFDLYTNDVVYCYKVKVAELDKCPQSQNMTTKGLKNYPVKDSVSK